MCRRLCSWQIVFYSIDSNLPGPPYCHFIWNRRGIIIGNPLFKFKGFSRRQVKQYRASIKFPCQAIGGMVCQFIPGNYHFIPIARGKCHHKDKEEKKRNVFFHKAVHMLIEI